MLALVLAIASASLSPRPSPPPRPRVTVSVVPSVPHAGEGVSAVAIARDPGHVLHCPEIVFEWGDGCSSRQASDCPDVYAMPEDEPDRYVVRPPYLHPYRAPGSYVVRATFKSGGRQYIADAAVVVH